MSCLAVTVLHVSEASMKFPAGHVNNQYNTCYHALVKSGVTPEKAQENLKVGLVPIGVGKKFNTGVADECQL